MITRDYHNTSPLQFFFGTNDDEFASPEDILDALQQEGASILDARSSLEIAATGKVELAGVAWFQATADELVSEALSSFPDKDAPIVIHCASGKRANAAQSVLQSQGYTNVINAGGFDRLNSVVST